MGISRGKSFIMILQVMHLTLMMVVHFLILEILWKRNSLQKMYELRSSNSMILITQSGFMSFGSRLSDDDDHITVHLDNLVFIFHVLFFLCSFYVSSLVLVDKINNGSFLFLRIVFSFLVLQYYTIHPQLLSRPTTLIVYILFLLCL